MEFKVKYRVSDANIQAEVYHRLRNICIPCYLEYKYENSRFDMVILDKTMKNIIAIVEFKFYRYVSSLKRDYRITKQYKKYSKYNLPLLYCRHKTEINRVINDIVRIYKNYHNI